MDFFVCVSKTTDLKMLQL